MAPVLVPVDDVPVRPDGGLAAALAHAIVETVQPPLSTVALLLSRPGRGPATPNDRERGQLLQTTISPSLSPWPIALATTDHLGVLIPDVHAG